MPATYDDHFKQIELNFIWEDITHKLNESQKYKLLKSNITDLLLEN